MCEPQFNELAPQRRNDDVPVKVRAVLLTLVNEQKAVLEAELVPDDTSQHMHKQFKGVLESQLSREKTPT